MNNYFPTIGLEIHAELKTRTKMFCDSVNDPDEKEPNKNTCPVCLGHPGTLPTINKKAVEAVIRVGLALNGKINPITKFDRKNYFYPDLPKGYQISQYDQPLVVGGKLLGVDLTRIHLEEDAGKLGHAIKGSPAHGSKQEHFSMVDFNRAGVPLMELVTEPDMHGADEAVAFAKEFQLILRYLGVSDADLERGQMRFDLNISVSDTDALGAKVEVKNLNSFAALRGAIEYEIKRQTEILESGEKITQETRGWDDAKEISVSQRSKEEAHDYRYFPEPDLPPIETSIFDIEKMRAELPELPAQKRERFQKEFRLSEKQADLLVQDKPIGDFFEAAVSELALRETSGQAEQENPELSLPKKSSEELLFNYLTSDLAGLMGETGISFGELKISPERLAHLVDLIASSKIMSRQAKDILRKMFETGDDPEYILNVEGLHTVSDEGELAHVIQEIIAENPAAVADYRKGKTASMQFLIGKAMGKLKGRGNPEALKEIFKKTLTL